MVLQFHFLHQRTHLRTSTSPILPRTPSPPEAEGSLLSRTRSSPTAPTVAGAACRTAEISVNSSMTEFVTVARSTQVPATINPPAKALSPISLRSLRQMPVPSLARSARRRRSARPIPLALPREPRNTRRAKMKMMLMKKPSSQPQLSVQPCPSKFCPTIIYYLISNNPPQGTLRPRRVARRAPQKMAHQSPPRRESRRARRPPLSRSRAIGPRQSEGQARQGHPGRRRLRQDQVRPGDQDREAAAQSRQTPSPAPARRAEGQGCLESRL